MFDASKRAYFVRVLGAEAVASLEKGLAHQARRLEAAGVNWADLAGCIGPACVRRTAAAPAAPAAGLPASPYVAQLGHKRPTAGVVAAVAELRGLGADPAGQYIADLAERGATS